MDAERSGFERELTRRRLLRRGVPALAGVAAGGLLLPLLRPGVARAGVVDFNTLSFWQEDATSISWQTNTGGIQELMNNARYYGASALSQSDWISFADQQQNLLTEYWNLGNISQMDEWMNFWWYYVTGALPWASDGLTSWWQNGTARYFYEPAMVAANIAANGQPTSDRCSELLELRQVSYAMGQVFARGPQPTAVIANTCQLLNAALDSISRTWC